jgi:hypothetical protein
VQSAQGGGIADVGKLLLDGERDGMDECMPCDGATGTFPFRPEFNACFYFLGLTLDMDRNNY